MSLSKFSSTSFYNSVLFLGLDKIDSVLNDNKEGTTAILYYHSFYVLQIILWKAQFCSQFMKGPGIIAIGTR